MAIPRLIKSLESVPIGDGDLLGQPFKVLPYQKKFLTGTFKPNVLRAGLSLARGGGKSGLASSLCLDAVRPKGVLHKTGFETVLVASSFAQAKIVFEAVKTSLELMGEDWEYRILDQQNMASIQHKQTKARLRVAGSDNKRAHGWRVNLVIGDEPAQWGPRSEALASAIRTALGKRAGAKAIFIGTRPSSDSHFFARLLEETDKSVYAQIHSAGSDDPPFAIKSWRRANPGLRFGLPDVAVLRAEARMARRDPAELATFRALRLNQGTSETIGSYLIDNEVWRGIEVTELPPREGPCAWGIDLGGTAAFCAVASWWPATGRLEGFVACGDDPELSQRALADGVSGVYENMLEAGELVLMEGKTVNAGVLMAEAVRRFGQPRAIAADRWRAR